jgi:D-alanine-D-alanine ligase
MVSDREVKFAPETEGSPRLVIAKDLSDELRARIHRAAHLAYRALKLRDYARMDFRIAKTGEPYMLEANPNPYLEKTGELAMAAAEVGLDYAQLVSKILESAAVRYHLHVREAPGKRARAAQS